MCLFIFVLVDFSFPVKPLVMVFHQWGGNTPHLLGSLASKSLLRYLLNEQFYFVFEWLALSFTVLRSWEFWQTHSVVRYPAVSIRSPLLTPLLSLYPFITSHPPAVALGNHESVFLSHGFLSSRMLEPQNSAVCVHPLWVWLHHLTWHFFTLFAATIVSLNTEYSCRECTTAYLF